MTTYWCRWAWLDALTVAPRVQLTIKDGLIDKIKTGVDPALGDIVLDGLVVPGFANAHSHAFHRALRGRTHSGSGDFWTWRDQMYWAAGALDPDSYYELAVATYSEMLQAGMTVVGEFHYVHHQKGGQPYSDPNAMGQALIAAAKTAGIRLTLLDTCYLQSGVDGSLVSQEQTRFSDGDAEAWRQRVESLPTSEATVLHGSAIHSVRSVGVHAMKLIADRGGIVHAHVSEQPAENTACLTATGLTPTALLNSVGAIGASFTAVHATHLAPNDITILGDAAASIAFCPTTERDLADGVGPSVELQDAGCSLVLGSDSHAVIDHFAEAQALEMNERVTTGRRGHHSPLKLWRTSTSNGYASLGWSEGGTIRTGALADLVTIDMASPRTAGTPTADPLAVVFSATASDVTHVMVAGELVVDDSKHLGIDVAESLDRSIRNLYD